MKAQSQKYLKILKNNIFDKLDLTRVNEEPGNVEDNSATIKNDKMKETFDNPIKKKASKKNLTSSISQSKKSKPKNIPKINILGCAPKEDPVVVFILNFYFFF